MILYAKVPADNLSDSGVIDRCPDPFNVRDGIIRNIWFILRCV